MKAYTSGADLNWIASTGLQRCRFSAVCLYEAVDLVCNSPLSNPKYSCASLVSKRRASAEVA